ITAVGDECRKLAVCDRTRPKLEWRDVDLMRGPFVVEREAGAVMPDRRQTCVVAMPLERRRLHFEQRPTRPIRGAQRIAREDMLEISEDQFLMLLLVIDAEVDQRGNVGREIARENA